MSTIDASLFLLDNMLIIGFIMAALSILFHIIREFRSVKIIQQDDEDDDKDKYDLSNMYGDYQ
jgi:hypothetical protein